MIYIIIQPNMFSRIIYSKKENKMFSLIINMVHISLVLDFKIICVGKYII